MMLKKTFACFALAIAAGAAVGHEVNKHTTSDGVIDVQDAFQDNGRYLVIATDQAGERQVFEVGGSSDKGRQSNDFLKAYIEAGHAYKVSTRGLGGYGFGPAVIEQATEVTQPAVPAHP